MAAVASAVMAATAEAMVAAGTAAATEVAVLVAAMAAEATVAPRASVMEAVETAKAVVVTERAARCSTRHSPCSCRTCT